MKIKQWVLGVGAGCLVGSLQAKEIVLDIATENLSGIWDTVESGDTILVKGNGSMSDAVSITLDKAVTIKPYPGSTPSFSSNLYIDIPYGIEHPFTLQGFYLYDGITVREGHDIRILNNVFDETEGLTVDDLANGTAFKNIYIVGNEFRKGVISVSSSLESSDIVGDFVIAGNHIHNTGRALNQQFHASQAMIIGNYFSCDFTLSSLNNTGCVELKGDFDKFIANRVSVYGMRKDYTHTAVYALGRNVSVLNNRITGTFNLADAFSFNGIVAEDVNDTVNHAFIANNTVVYSNLQETQLHESVAINALFAAKVNNNILVGFSSDKAVQVGTIDPLYNGQVQGFMNNVCDLANYDCADTHNIDAQPKFADTQSFTLQSDSPAIDFGLTDKPYYYDLDGSANDAGIYGGPWSIEQYDAQRQLDRAEPYIYPLVDANQTLYNGEIHPRILGVARFRHQQ